ncbi:Nad-dependent amine oxidase [Tupanvirus soda lake]|uniref:Nad-dependent amine oxidase n=2 Tax=Tupanvirus TaxID=2094720 RepID=A0A6N1NPE7_9VIRU|nr:Nad-dependent amine oxidase [Tupanvirus soda lake]QKU35750.1 Nad-dependent amine oxidase [Tupanvirus soda lake]
MLVATLVVIIIFLLLLIIYLVNNQNNSLSNNQNNKLSNNQNNKLSNNQNNELLNNQNDKLLITNQHNINESYDIVIVGCGISGAFCAARLSQFYPNLKILVVEKNDKPGGKLMSSNVGLDVAVEYGGMRFFPNIHRYTDALVKQLGIQTIQKDYINPKNIAYLRGKHYQIGNLKQQNSYNLNQNEKGHDPMEYVNNIINNQLSALGITWEMALYNEYLSSISFWQFIKMHTSNEMTYFHDDVSGYNLMTDNIHCGFAMIENVALGSEPNSPQLFIKNGYQSVVFSLLNKVHNNVKIIMNTELVSFENNKNHISLNLLNDNQKIQINTKKLILTTGKNDTEKLYPWPIQIKNVFDLVIPWIALKIFIVFNESWWNKFNLFAGKSVTDLPLRQVWYYAKNILMIYCDNIDTQFWYNSLKLNNSSKIMHEQSWIDINMVDPILSYSLLSQLSEMHNFPITLDMVKSISWKYWPEGSCLWKPCNVLSAKKILASPLPNVYLTSSSWSVWQGWTNGSVENADDLLAEYFGVSSILDIGI